MIRLYKLEMGILTQQEEQEILTGLRRSLNWMLADVSISEMQTCIDRRVSKTEGFIQTDSAALFYCPFHLSHAGVSNFSTPAFSCVYPQDQKAV